MIVVSIPFTRSAEELTRRCEEAAAAGAEAILLGEEPLGAWRSPASALPFAAAATPLPVALCLRLSGRHPLAVAEEICVVQHSLGPGVWIVLSGSSEETQAVVELLAPTSPVRPRPIPFAVRPWAVGEAVDTRLPTIVPATSRSQAAGRYGDVEELREAKERDVFPPIWILTAPKVPSAPELSEVISSLRVHEVVSEPWFSIAVEGFRAT